MKTIEEKAKAYDEIIERAKTMLAAGEVMYGKENNASQLITDLIPELAESEDERMMREFNDWLCEEIECRTNDLRDEKDRRTLNMLCYILTKVKDWLEKQKEQKPIEFKNDELVEIIKGEFEGFRRLLKKKGIDYEPQYGYWEGFARLFDSSAREYVKEQKEQKPTPDWMPKFLDELRSKKHYFDWDEHREIEGQILAIINWIAPNYFEEKEQKSAEKQDYSGLNDLERAIHRGFLCAGVENVPVTIIKETAQDCLAHIKPVELKYWDKEMIQSIISILERDNCFKVVDEKPMRIFAHEQEINYLRNLQEYLYPNLP